MRKKIFILLSVCLVMALVGGGAEDSLAGAVLGEPGLSFKYDSTFGIYQEPYFDDALHLNQPRGLATDGDNIWIAECYGRRALKYTSNDTSTLLMQIGKAGFKNTGDIQISCLNDVAVDHAGNVWLVDNSHLVIKLDATGNYLTKLGERRKPGSDNGHFNRPFGAAVDSHNNIYISDWRNHRVQIFDNDGNYLATIGSGFGSEDYQIRWPEHLTIDENDRLYIPVRQRVDVFDVSAAPITITLMGSIDFIEMDGNPAGVAVDLPDKRIIVADSKNIKVHIFNSDDWSYVGFIDLETTPTDVAVDAPGNLYVAQSEPTSSQVLQYDSDLSLLRSFGTKGVPYLTDNYHIFSPSGVAVGNDNSIYVTESEGQRLLKINSDGYLQWTIGEPGVWGNDNFHFWHPQDVDVNVDGRIYVADTDNCRIQIYNPDSSYHETLGNNCGDGINEFRWVEAIAIAPNGDIFIAEPEYHRIRVYSNNMEFITTITNTGSTGGNLPFEYVENIEVDIYGNLYIADTQKHVVHVFNNALEFQYTLGEYGVENDWLGAISYPDGLSVDERGRIYINNQVFDNRGAFLTILGNGQGNGTGNLRGIQGLEIDLQGSLFVADTDNHRIQKFTRGVPGWKQVNINGFGDYDNIAVHALEVFGYHLYAGLINGGEDTDTPIWRMDKKGTWEPVVSEGFILGGDEMVNDFIKYKNKLYVGIGSWTFGIENSLSKGIWRSTDGTNWTRVVIGGFNDPQNMEFASFSVFRNTLYASTWSISPEHGAEIWSTRNGDVDTWIVNVANGFGNVDNIAIQSMVEYKGCLYAGTINNNIGNEGSEIWRTCNGTDWHQVMQNGFGNPFNDGIGALGVYKNRLYAGTRNWNNPDAGAELWVCRVCNGNDWQMIPIERGFGDVNNFAINNLIAVNNIFFATLNNRVTGLEIWQTFDGRNWIQINPDGFGDSVNYFSTRGSLPMAIFHNQIYFGTFNIYQGGEIWKLCCPYNKSRWAWWYSCWAGAPPYQCNLPVNNCICDIP